MATLTLCGFCEIPPLASPTEPLISATLDRTSTAVPAGHCRFSRFDLTECDSKQHPIYRIKLLGSHTQLEHLEA